MLMEIDKHWAIDVSNCLRQAALLFADGVCGTELFVVTFTQFTGPPHRRARDSALEGSGLDISPSWQDSGEDRWRQNHRLRKKVSQRARSQSQEDF
jgi:hypothetical protein